MPKIIAPKRTSKSVTVEDYWAIREKFSKKQQTTNVVYKEKEVEKRHRFERLSDQIKAFNPLDYFITKEQDYSTDIKTHTHAYLQSIFYRLPQEIMHVKRLMFGLSSILENIGKIYGMLWDHLNSDDAWKLIQSLLKDTRSEPYDLWIEQGLEKIVEGVGKQFKQSRFKQLFHTLCIFMEVCFQKIAENQETVLKFLSKMGQFYFGSQNKYIRRFSIASVSYVLSNLDDNLFKNFLLKAIDKNSTTEYVLPYISDILAQRLKYSEGCLTPNSLQELITVVGWLSELKIEDEVFIKFVYRVLSNLKEKRSHEENLTLFDFEYIIKAFLHLSNQGKIKARYVIEGIINYLEEATQDKREKKRRLNEQSLKEVSQFTWKNLPQLPQNQQIYRILALTFSLPLQNVSNIRDYLSQTNDQHLVLQFLQLIDENLQKDTSMVILAGFKNHILNFLNKSLAQLEDSSILVVYRLFLIAKRHSIQLNLKKLFDTNIDIKSFIQKLIEVNKSSESTEEKEKLYEYTLVFIRLLTILELPSTLKPVLSKLMNQVMKNYQVVIKSFMNKNHKRDGNIFSCSNFTEEIFLYSHSSINLVWQGFNIVQSFIQIEKSLNSAFIDRTNPDFRIWHKMAINRPSISNQIKQVLQADPDNYLTVLQSRHRIIRHMTIQYLRENKIFHQHDHILEMVEQIEQEDVNLETERNVKRMLLDMLRYVQSNQLGEKLSSALESWCLGFAFTGFKLIEESLANFLSGLIEVQDNINLNILIRFLEYYTFKNSRVYDDEIRKFFKSSEIQQKQLELSPKFTQLVNTDFENYELETVEFIGVDRVTLAISKSEKVKKKLGEKLMSILKQYFNQQFVRFKLALIHNQGTYLNENGQVNQLLLPPKTTFLKQILKIVPEDFLPPLQCLHYTSDYLKLESVSKIKRQGWELLWNKTTKMDHTRIRFESMSSREMELYIHFLWGELLKADANKLRIIIEHIRDHMNHKVEYFMQIFYDELTLKVENEDQLRKIFVSMDSRKLLTFIYILKSMVKTLKNYMRNNYLKILKLLVNIIEILESSKKQIQEGQMQAQEQQEQENDEQSLSDNQNEQKLTDNKKYKNHRKQVFKILNSLVSMLADQIEPELVDNILQIFSNQDKINNLGKVGVHSTPGLLLFFKELSKHSKFHYCFVKYQVFDQIQQIFSHGFSVESSGSVSASIQVLNGLVGIVQENQMIDQGFISVISSEIGVGLLKSIFAWINSVNKVRTDLQFSLFRITLSLMKICEVIDPEWQKYLLMSMAKIVSLKTISQSIKNKLALLIQISMEYQKKAPNTQFLISMLTLIPQLKQINHRKLIVNSISKDVATGKQKTIGQSAVEIVTGLNSTIDGGLVIQIDYAAFFDAINKYKEKYAEFNGYEQEFVVYNVLAYLSSPQLSVRKAVSATMELFLSFTTISQRDLVARLFRIVGEELRKPHNSQDQIFWSIFGCLGYFVKWIIKNDLSNSGSYSYFSKFVSSENGNSNDIFDMLCAIAQNRKLDGLKALKTILKQEDINFASKIGDKYPNALITIILPVLEHFILPITQTTKDRYQIAGNLTSSLSHVSLEVFELAMKKGGESLQKKQLKRMISKIKFEDGHLKKNILIIKIISQIVESINLPRVTETIHKIISEEGFEDFHKKIVEKESRVSKIKEDDNDSDSEEEIRKKIAFNGINNQIEDDELINIGYLNLDKKLLQAEEADKDQGEENSIVRFLRVNVLAPLKTMLMFENRSEKNAKEQTDKSRMFLSIAVTKIILKFPTDIFVNQLQKILSKLGKLLKKKQIEVRQNSRKCLAEIAKLIGPDMFYLIFRQLKFHLRDNFQNHILNYSIYYILQKYGTLESGSIDHCLPIILPSIIDQIYGRSAAQKEMVDENLIPTLNMQSKKRKGNDLLAIICKQISMKKIDYLVKYFEKFLLDYMNTEANVSKYEQMLTNIVGGLNKNEHIMKVENSSEFIEIVYESIQKLKSKIKLYKFEDTGIKHESTVKQELSVGKRLGKQVLQIQEEAGRNASIFKKQAKIIQQRRNHEILVGCFMQFHLAVLALLIKRKIIDSEEHSEKFESILTFIVECIQHRDNRLVHKCLKVIHNVIHWKKMKNIAQIRRKTSRKIFALIQKLTSADQDLLKECFTLLNDLFEQINITAEVLHILITIIKLHITAAERAVAQQPYKLLKTVLIKISDDHKLMFDPAVYELYEFVRANLISTTLDSIRNTCRQICSIYIKQTPQPQPQPQLAHKSKQKRQNSLDFHKQISFYLNNLDCKYSQTQQAILSVIKTYVASHGKEEIEETGEVIVMSLGTAYSNDGDNQRQIGDLVRFVVQRIDHSKVLGLVDKCMVWVSNQNHMIVQCGFFILQNILIAKGSVLNAPRKNAISSLCTKILQNQLVKVQLYLSDLKQKIHQSKTLKENPEWEGIIDNEDTYLIIEKCLKFAFGIINYLLDQHKMIEPAQVELLWKLASAPSSFLHSQAGAILMKVNSITAVIGERIISIDPGEENSLKNKIFNIVKNASENDTMEHCCKLVHKVLEEINGDQRTGEVCEAILLSMLNRVSRSILNLKKNEKSMALAYDVLQTVLASDQEICQRLLKNEKLLGEIFWNIAKVNRNDMIITEIKEKNEQLGDIIKGAIGEAEFYRRLASVEADRKQKKNSEKAQMLKLAITDQQAYGRAKAKKKHKKQ